MQPLLAFNLWKWIEQNRAAFEPPVGNKVIWEDSQFTAMIVRGPNARRDFHVDPSDEIFYMLRGDMASSTCATGSGRRRSSARASCCWCRPSFPTPRTGRPTPGGWWWRSSGGPIRWNRSCGSATAAIATLHEVTMHVADIEGELKAAIEGFDASVALRTCRACGHVQPERPPVPVHP